MGVNQSCEFDTELTFLKARDARNNVLQADEYSTALDVSNYPLGIYSMQVSDGRGRSMSQRLVRGEAGN